MKTLDEVIKALEICTESHGCIGCPYLAGNDKKCEKQDADALHYLKMYHSDMQMYAENQKYWEDELKQKIKDFGDAKERYIAKLKKLDIGTLNEPLSWEQLKQMEGKPVWVEFLKDGESYDAEWIIIQDINDECMGDTQRFAYQKSDYGDRWQAYRKERDERYSTR